MNRNNKSGALYISIGVLLAGLYQMTMYGGVGITVSFLVFMLTPIFVIAICLSVGLIIKEYSNGRGRN